ncbi:MAG TPA: permease prefix domain 1-containing protein [Clostridiaceae bacterium]
MDSLKNHVDSMFIKYKANNQIKELKAEVLSNLEAKVKDLMQSGMEYSQAVNKAKESINSIDYLIDGNRKVYINKYKLEYLQISLLYSIITWITTIPLTIIGAGILLNWILFICSFILGVVYFQYSRKRESEYLQCKDFINLEFMLKARKMAWIIWDLYIVVITLCTTVIRFGSNIWFSRPINISGPYQFAEVTIGYVLPFVSIIIPLIINIAPKLILRYEVGEDDENKE